MAETLKKKEKEAAEKVSEEQQKKIQQEQARAQGPAIVNEPPPKQKSMDEVAREVGREAEQAAQFDSKMGDVLGHPQQFESKMESLMGARRPPSYPKKEQYLYRQEADIEDPRIRSVGFSALIETMSVFPLDFDTKGVKAFPGLTEKQGDVVFKDHLSNAPASLVGESEQIIKNMKMLAMKFKEAFVPVDGINLASGERVLIGSPINFMSDYTGVPVYLQQGDRTQFIMAYRSGSQGCWRRYAGAHFSPKENPEVTGTAIKSILYKGAREELGKEAWQNLDHRIQKRIDLVVRTIRPLDLAKTLHLKSLYGKGLGEKAGLLPANEEAIQFSMLAGAKAWSIKEAGNEPDLSRIITHWPATGNPLYKNQINAVVESRNGQFRYGISLTPFGVFVQYIEDNKDRGINRGGSPSRGVKLEKGSEWILTPVVEYTTQVDTGKPGEVLHHVPGKRNLREVPDDIRDLFPDSPPASQSPADEEHLVGKERIVFDNLHTVNSPFMVFSTKNKKLDEVYAALKGGQVDDAQAAFAKWVSLPLQEKV